MRKMIVAALGVLLLAAAVLADTTYRVEDDVRNQSGVVVSGATVTVYNADTTTPATLYSGIDTALGTKSNPVYTDSSGRYWFYALPGRYDIKVERTGVTTYTREDVIVGASGGGGGGSDWPSIEDYGAGAGDTTDDTDEINAAVAAVSASGGGKILVPSGDFYVNKAGATSSTSQSGIILMDGVTLVGEPGARIIVPAQQGSTASPFPSCWAISADGAYGIGIEDLEIVFEDGQPSGATHQITGVNLSSCGDVRINNVTITGPEYAGIYVYSQHDEHENSGLSISGCNIRSTGIYGRGIIVQRVTGGGIISQNEIFDIGHSGILLDSCRGMVVSENPIREVDRDGIECLGGLNNTITANPVASFGRYGISAYKSGSSVPTGYTIGSNTLRGNNANGDSGIYISSAVSTTIDANTISTVNWDGVNVGASIGGIFCTQSSTDPLDDVVISDNVIRDIDPDYAGGLTRRPFAIQVRGSGGPIRGVVVSDNNITNSYGAVYMRATGARTYTAGTIRSVTVGVDTVGVSDTTAPTASNLAMAAVEDGTSGNVVINWSLTANEQSTSTARWQINSEGWNTESTSGLATNHSAQINTSVDAVQDDTVKVNVRLVDQVGNASAWLNV
ncbi:MAG TPA: right-handed parallel beta-helix repeat-containing protein, partial [Candidatus Nanopelagicales bacterium]|nr:right-handed parallel beta-helix repeat-containing protein [Candidatus Nanopelagicales bacterium]